MLDIIFFIVLYFYFQIGLKIIILIPSERLMYCLQIAQLVSSRIMIWNQASHFTSYSLELWDYSLCSF